MQLSGGQQQRLCIAGTIATRPQLICMDEATSALDPLSTGKVEELLLELKRDFMIVIVTHNMQQAKRISDLTGFMYLGELVEFGETKQIFEDPHDEKTREYIREFSVSRKTGRNDAIYVLRHRISQFRR